MINILTCLSGLTLCPTLGKISPALFDDQGGMMFQRDCGLVTNNDIHTRDAPKTLDWRAQNVVTNVKNQKDCGASWAFALVGNIEGQYALKHGKKREFSEQQPIDCSEDCNGCDNCASASFMSNLLSLGGIMLESDYPYLGKQQDTCDYKKELAKAKIAECTNYDLKDEDLLKEILFKKGPLYIAVDGDSMKQYKSGILVKCPEVNINHAVLLVGYGSDNGTDYWLIKNSLGKLWGENGYARIRRGVNACGILNAETASVTIK